MLRSILDRGGSGIVLGLLLYAVAFSALILYGGEGRFFLAATDIGSAIPPFIVAVLAISAARKSRGQTRTAWYLIGAAILCWGIGEALWAYSEVILDQSPFPSLADVGYLAFYPLMLLGILSLSSPDSNKRLRTVMDALAVTLAGGALLWNAVMEPVYQLSAESTLEKVLSVAYPLGDMLLLFPLAVTFYGSRRGRSASIVLALSAGVAIMLVADLAFAVASANDTYASGSIIDIGWVAGSLVIGLAAVLQVSWRENLRSSLGPTIAPTWKQLLPLILLPPVLFGLVLAGYSDTAPEELPSMILASLFVLTVVCRQAVTIADSVSLNQTLMRVNAELTRTHTEVEMRSTQLANLLQMEEIRARTDALTGVKNRAAINEVLARMEKSDFSGAALILFDIDGMKQINDRHGHLVGDKVLRALSSALSTDGAVVSRFGGDEFLVVLPNGDAAKAESYIRGARRLLQVTRVTNEDGELVPIQVSAGAALFPKEGATTQDVLRLADERMYATKNNGTTAEPAEAALLVGEDAA